MTTNSVNIIEVANKLATPLPSKAVVVNLSPREILAGIESLLERLSQRDIKVAAGDWIEETGADSLLELSGELRQASQVLFDIVHNHWTASAEETLRIACK